MSPVTIDEVIERIASGLDIASGDALALQTKADALILASTLRSWASEVEHLAEVLPQGERRKQ